MMKRLFKSLFFVVLILPLASLGMETKNDEIFWGKCLVLHAVQNDSDQFEFLLRSKKCDLNQREQENGRTALMIAARRRNKKIAQMLIRCGADLNLQCNNHGVTALMSAAVESPEIMAMLIDAGADLNLQTKDGETALMVAAAWSDVSNCHTLIDAMIKQNSEQKERIYAFLVCLKRVPGFRNTNQARDLFKPIFLSMLTDIRQEINRIGDVKNTLIRRKEIKDQLLEKFGFQPSTNPEVQ